MDVPLQVMDLNQNVMVLPKTLPQVKYHYYTMCTFHDMDLNQELNQSQ